MSGQHKITTERNQRTLLELANLPGNDVCADCKARTPRWASYNLGIFLCMNCASIHRKIGTHITKVKSLMLDQWTKEQVEHMKQVGNIKSNAIFNPDEKRHPPPTNLIDSERDSELEKFIRAKYEYRSFVPRTGSMATHVSTGSSSIPTSGFSTSASMSIRRDVPVVNSGPSVLSSSRSIDRSAAVAALLGPSRSASSRLSRSPSSRRETVPPASTLTPSASSTTPVAASIPPQSALSSVSQPQVSVPLSAVPPSTPTRAATQPASPFTPSVTQQPAPPTSQNSTWNDLQSINRPQTIDATLPLQVLAQPVTIPAGTSTPFLTTNPYMNLSSSPSNAFQMAAQPTSAPSAGGGMTLNYGAPNGLSSASTQFQSSLMNPASATLNSNPSPNPFAPPALASSGAVSAYGTSSGFTGVTSISLPPQTSFSPSFALQQPQTPFSGLTSVTPQPQTPFSGPMGTPQTPFGAPVQSPFIPQQQVQQTQMFSPQPQLQVPNTINPYMQSPSPGTPYMGAQFGGTPSPFSAAQPLPQMQPMQQAPQQGLGGTSPFTSWIQQPPAQQGQGYGWGGGM